MKFSMRSWLLGAVTLPVLGLALAGATAAAWPGLPLIGTLGRMLDSLSFHLFAALLPGALLLRLLGARWLAGAVVLMALSGAGLSLGQHIRHSEPRVALSAPPPGAARAALSETAEAPADTVTVLWFNMLRINRTPPADLIQALADSPADLVILGEGTPLQSHLEALQHYFPIQIGCRQPRCEILALARAPLNGLSMPNMYSTRPERIVRMETDLAAGNLTVLGVHLVKPWFDGFNEIDEWYLMNAALRTEGPLMMIGDFNAAPWSKRLVRLRDTCGLVPLRFPAPTWPASAGRFGVPIDLVLLRDGAEVISAEPWGADLGSNHRGLLVTLQVRPRAADPVVTARCRAAAAYR